MNVATLLKTAGDDGALDAYPEPRRRFLWQSLCRCFSCVYRLPCGDLIEIDVALWTASGWPFWERQPGWTWQRIGPLILAFRIEA